jgi:hypothetical protein
MIHGLLSFAAVGAAGSGQLPVPPSGNVKVARL